MLLSDFSGYYLPQTEKYKVYQTNRIGGNMNKANKTDWINHAEKMRSLTGNQFLVVKLLLDNNRVFRGTYTDLAKRLGKDKSNIGRVIKSLEQKGIVKTKFNESVSRKEIIGLVLVSGWEDRL